MQDLLSVITRIPLFVGLKPEQMKNVLRYFKVKTFEVDEMFFRENDQADALFYLVEGNVRILKNLESGGAVPVAKVVPGNFVGELAILDASFRSASVQAMTPVTTVCIKTKDFDLLVKNDPDLGFILMKAVARVISEQLRRTTTNLASTQKRLDM